jgi:hypothetical protein
MKYFLIIAGVIFAFIILGAAGSRSEKGSQTSEELYKQCQDASKDQIDAEINPNSTVSEKKKYASAALEACGRN